MEKITLRRTGGSQVVFEGEEIASVSGQFSASGSEELRWYQAAVYRAADGRYVGEFAYCSRWADEHENRVVVVAKSPAEIRRWLESENPTPASVGFPPGPAYSERQKNLLDRLAANRRALVSRLLDDELFAASLDDLGEIAPTPASEA